jgi:GAF domain
MPETRLKEEADRPGDDSNNDRDQQISALLATTVEQIRSAMSASGAVIAVRDPEGACCLASTGEAPPVGSRLQPDSAFTRECLETGEVVLCEDTENDSRILPSVAKSLHFRSAVAVPIQMQGCVIGVIEVFSSRPSEISPPDVDVLEECANLVAPVIAPRAVPSAQIVQKAPPHPFPAPPTASAEEREGNSPSVSSNWFPKEPGLSEEQPVESLRPSVERGPASDAGLPSNSTQSAEDSTAAQITRGRAASLSFLAIVFFALSFFLVGMIRPMTMATSSPSPAPQASDSARRDSPATSTPEDGAAQKTVKPRGHNRSRPEKQGGEPTTD